MRSYPENAGSRRGFFRAAARYGALGLLTALAGRAAVRGRLPNQRCDRNGICSGCGVFAGCELPAALSAKQATRRQSPA